MSTGIINPPVSPVYEFSAFIGIEGVIRVNQSDVHEIEGEIRDAITTALDTFECCCRGHSENKVRLKVRKDSTIALYSLLEVSP